MSDPSVEQYNCEKILGQLDGYLDNSLSPASTNELLAHLNQCSACSDEFASRTRLRARVRSAVKNIEAPGYLATRIRANIRDTRGSTFHWKAALATAAVVVAMFTGVTVAYQFGHLRLNVKSRDAYIGTVSNHVATILRVGLGDHIHCTVFRNYPKNPPSMEKFVADMGPDYSGLIPVVRKEVPEDLNLVMAHRCRYQGRPFIHLALKNDARLVSVIVTSKRDGEAFTTEELVPALTESGIPIYRSGVQRFQIAAFETRDHLVYLVSDLTQHQNMELMRAMAPQIKAYLHKLES